MLLFNTRHGCVAFILGRYERIHILSLATKVSYEYASSPLHLFGHCLFAMDVQQDMSEQNAESCLFLVFMDDGDLSIHCKYEALVLEQSIYFIKSFYDNIFINNSVPVLYSSKPSSDSRFPLPSPIFDRASFEDFKVLSPSTTGDWYVLRTNVIPIMKVNVLKSLNATMFTFSHML